MTIEELFAIMEATPRREGQTKTNSITLYREADYDGGGYRADASRASCAYGDTIADAIQAAHDSFLRLPSARARLRPPYPSSAPRTLENAWRCDYDYRVKDWSPEDDPEATRYMPTNRQPWWTRERS